MKKIWDYFRRHDRGWVLSLFAAVCIVYLPFLGSPFVFDDLPFFSGNIVEHYTHWPFQFELRWLPYASLGWTAAVFSDVLSYPFRLGNLLLHAANVILLFFLLRRLVAVAIADNRESPAIIRGAWLGALVFAIHPVAVYAVGYVIQRSILMATLFSLLALMAYLKGLEQASRRWLWASVAGYFLAVLSKEHAIMLPAVMLALTVVAGGTGKALFHRLWPIYLGCVAVALFVLSQKTGVVGTAYEVYAPQMLEHAEEQTGGGSDHSHLLSILTQCALFFKYLGLWLVPNPGWMSVDMREHFVSAWSDWRGWAGVTGFVLYGLLGIRLLLRCRWLGIAGLALLYPWLQFFVEFSSIRVQEPFVLYRSYLWMPGIMLFSPLLLAKLPSRRALLGVGCAALLLMPLAWNRLWVFADNYRLWNDAALLLRSERESGADRIFYNRGNAEMAARNWEDAIADFQRAAALTPQLAPIHYALGLAYVNAGRYQDGITQFDAAIALTPDDARFYLAKGMSLKRLHQDDSAMRQIEKSCELKNMMACVIVQMKLSKK